MKVQNVSFFFFCGNLFFSIFDFRKKNNKYPPISKYYTLQLHFPGPKTKMEIEEEEEHSLFELLDRPGYRGFADLGFGDTGESFFPDLYIPPPPPPLPEDAPAPKRAPSGGISS